MQCNDGFKAYASAIVTSTDVVPSAAGRTSAGTAAPPFGTSSSTLSALDGAVGLDPGGTICARSRLLIGTEDYMPLVD